MNPERSPEDRFWKFFAAILAIAVLAGVAFLTRYEVYAYRGAVPMMRLDRWTGQVQKWGCDYDQGATSTGKYYLEPPKTPTVLAGTCRWREYQP